jgi:hypothetical protein
MSECVIMIMQYLSPAFGFLGTVLIFFYGIPKQIDTGGRIGICLEQEDKEEKKKIKKYKLWSNIGLGLIALGFLLNFLTLIAPKILAVGAA